MSGDRAKHTLRTIVVVAVAVATARLAYRGSCVSDSAAGTGAGSYSVVAREPEALHPTPNLRAVLPELARDRGEVAVMASDRRGQ